MTEDHGEDKPKREFTPEIAQAWTLALYPAAMLLGVAFLLGTNTEITTEIIGLFIGLLTAGSLEAAVKKSRSKNGESGANRSYSDSDRDRVRPPSQEELGDDNRRRSDNSGGGSDFYFSLNRLKVFQLST